MIMPKLSENSDITEQTFSFYLTGLFGDSYIDFGEPNAALIGSDPVVYLDIEDESKYWTSKISGFRWDSSMED